MEIGQKASAVSNGWTACEKGQSILQCSWPLLFLACRFRPHFDNSSLTFPIEHVESYGHAVREFIQKLQTLL